MMGTVISFPRGRSLVVIERADRTGLFLVRTENVDPPVQRELSSYYQAVSLSLRLMRQHDCACIDYIHGEART